MCSQLLHHFHRRSHRAPAARVASGVATRGHRVRLAPQLVRRGGLLARFVSAVLFSDHAARRRRVGASRLHRRGAATSRERGDRRFASSQPAAWFSAHGALDAVRNGERVVSEPLDLGPMPTDRSPRTVDELVVRAPAAPIFSLAADVERWPTTCLTTDMFAFSTGAAMAGTGRDVGQPAVRCRVEWPTWWTSLMSVITRRAWRELVRFRHVRGITAGMDVEWTFVPMKPTRLVRIVHVWNGPTWPVIGDFAATAGDWSGLRSRNRVAHSCRLGARRRTYSSRSARIEVRVGSRA